MQYFGLADGEGQDPAAALNALLHRVGQLAVRVRSVQCSDPTLPARPLPKPYPLNELAMWVCDVLGVCIV